MSDRLQAILLQFQKMELKKHQVIQAIQNLTPDQYLRHPHDKSWSAGQVANHLYLSERNSLAYLRKKMAYPESIPPYTPKSWLGILLIRIVFLTKYKVKAPPSLDMWKIEEVMMPEILDTTWTRLREDFLSFLRQHEPAFGQQLVFRHPFAGRMSMVQMLIFINDHLRHHQHQLKRIINSVSK